MVRASRRKLRPRRITNVVSGWWLIGGCVLMCSVAWVWSVWAFVGATVIIALVLWDEKLREKHLQKLMRERIGEPICSFARSFNFRNTDTLLIRATHEEIQDYLNSESALFQLRASDRFERDLLIDGDDLEGLAIDIAGRAGRSLHQTKQNPYDRKVETVGDLVSFLSLQPRLNFSE